MYYNTYKERIAAMSYDTDPFSKIDEIIAISRDPEYFICNFNDGWLYFNPVDDCGFFEDFDNEYLVYSQILFPNSIQLLFFVRDTSLDDLNVSPDPYYKNIKELYSRCNVKLPRLFYEFESHKL